LERLYRSVLVRSFLWSISCGSVSKVAVLGTNLIAVRALKPNDFGLYAGLAATAVLASICWDMGVSAVLTREVAAGGLGLRETVIRGAVLRFQTLPMWVAVFSAGAWILARGGGVPAGAIARFAGGSLLYGLSMPLYATLRGRLQFALAEFSIATGRSATALISLAGLPSIGFFHGLGFFAVAILAGESVTLLTAAALAIGARPVVLRPASSSGAGQRLILKEALPFAANGMMVMAYNRFDVVLVAALSSTTQLALYAPASRLQDALQLIPGSILAIGLPIFSQAWNQPDGVARVQATIRNLMIGGMLIVLPVTVAAFVLTPWLLATVMGPDYLGATVATRILIWSLPFEVMLAPLVSALAATGRAPDTTKVVAVTALVALAGHLSLDWWLGATGGAIASLLRDPAAVVAAMILTRRAGFYGGLALHRRTVELAAVPKVPSA